MTKNDDDMVPQGYADLEEYHRNVREADELAFHVSGMFMDRELGVIGICMIRLMAKFILLNPNTAPEELMANFSTAVCAIAQKEREKLARTASDAPHTVN